MRTASQASTLAPSPAAYERICREFTWDVAREWLDGLPAGRGLNIAHEAVDRHAAGPRHRHVALRCLSRLGLRRDVTYAELSELSSRFAHALVSLGVRPGDRVFVMAGRIAELVVATLGTLKARAVVVPLYAAFGAEPIRARSAIAAPRVLVTTQSLHRRRIARIRASLTSLEHVIVVPDEPAPLPEGVLDWHALVEAAPPRFQIPPTAPDTPALVHFTSGTTGTPKGALHVHEAIVAHHATGRLALDLRDDDVLWCTADPGWVTGMSYALLAPLSCGITTVLDEAEFDARRWCRILQDERVSVWYTTPTAIRTMMRQGSARARRFDTSSLRFAASVGEPLDPEAVVWGIEAFGMPFHDNWWQTETGGIMIANVPALEVHPGSMGRPLPGVEAAIVERTPRGGVRVIERPDAQGEIAIRAGWPSMFRGYWGEPDRYAACFADGWYLTGDLARRDDEGYFWFVGRRDDALTIAGRVVGPFEVESVLLEHAAVAEAGVIGTPDPEAGELVKAFVTLKPSREPDDELRRELIGFARQRLGAALAPRRIEFVPSLPRTRSGKIMRRLLRARELGLPEGDLSTLEPFPS